MVLTCPQCNARLHLDDAKAPSRPFSVRCPKCQASVNHAPASTPESTPTPAVTSTASAESTAASFERPITAPAFKPLEECKSVSAEENAPGLSEIAKLLAEALQHSDRRAGSGRKRAAWDRRKVLVCASPAYRETIAESLL